MISPALIVFLVVVTILIIWYARKVTWSKNKAKKCDPTSWASQCAGGDVCQCAGPDKGWCTSPDMKKYAYGYSWQGAWKNPTAQNSICPDSCAAAAKAAGDPNWVFQEGMGGEYPLNCTHGHIVPGSCVAKVSGFTSDLAALKAPVCGGGVDGCALPVGPETGAFCHADTDCPTGSTCGFQKGCKHDNDCDNMTGPCVNGTCAIGNCTNSGCNNDDDCMLDCCTAFPCSDAMGCPNGGKCIKSADGAGYMCCGEAGGPCKGFGQTSCKNNKCTAVGMVAFSCDGPTGPYMPTSSTPLQAACKGVDLGGTCAVDVGKYGTLNGRCGRSCQSPTDPLACYPESICNSIDGQTTLANPRGACQSAHTTWNICFGS